MHFSTYASVAIATLAALTSAQNPFTFTTLTSITAGTSINITWAPSTGTVDTITLLLRQGDPTHLSTIATIAPSIQNSGSFLWTPPTTLVAGTGYAFEIVDDGNTAITNYSNQFSVISTNTVSSAAASTTASSVSGSTILTGSSTVKTSASTSAAKTTSGSSAATGSSTPSSTSTGGASATSVPGKSAAESVKVGIGMLGVVGAVMALL
ncbi:Ser-Thr-rich glycosyl-phosphatidyl-inositol-anchored membrane family-domain-containing protein [Hyaloscypha finlandica]|nr:Ser-Thr-rich glycosyl-phosphatidyl-inositol-anchored membrane family-domain-containing protein [Hyaloscypha finlandica]